MIQGYNFNRACKNELSRFGFDSSGSKQYQQQAIGKLMLIMWMVKKRY